MNRNDITSRIIDSAIEVHRELGGPVLLESVYEKALCWELKQTGLNVEQQKPVHITYKGTEISSDLRLDLVVDHRVIVECKATTEDRNIFKSQLLTYLRLTSTELGLLINFGTKYVKDGIARVVNDL